MEPSTSIVRVQFDPEDRRLLEKIAKDLEKINKSSHYASQNTVLDDVPDFEDKNF